MGGEWLSSRMKVYLDGRTGESKEWSLRPPPSPSDAMVSSLRRESGESVYLSTTHLALFPGHVCGMGIGLPSTFLTHV